VPLLWELHSRLSGALLVNTSGWWSNTFVHSNDFVKLAEHYCELSEGIACGKEASLRTVPLASIHQNGTAASNEYSRALKGFADTYTAAMLGRDSTQRDLSAMLLQWQLRDMCAFFNRARPLDELPMVIACSSHAPEAVQMSCLRFGEERAPFARWAVIPQSKLWWEVEGAKQVSFMIDLLSHLCARVRKL